MPSTIYVCAYGIILFCVALQIGSFIKASNGLSVIQSAIMIALVRMGSLDEYYMAILLKSVLGHLLTLEVNIGQTSTAPIITLMYKPVYHSV